MGVEGIKSPSFKNVFLFSNQNFCIFWGLLCRVLDLAVTQFKGFGKCNKNMDWDKVNSKVKYSGGAGECWCCGSSSIFFNGY